MERDWECSRGVFPLDSQPKGLVYIIVGGQAFGVRWAEVSFEVLSRFVRRSGLYILCGALSGGMFGRGADDGRGSSLVLRPMTYVDRRPFP